MILHLNVDVNFIQYVILLLLLPLSLNSSSLSGANFNSGKTESSPQIYPHIDGKFKKKNNLIFFSYLCFYENSILKISKISNDLFSHFFYFF